MVGVAVLSGCSGAVATESIVDPGEVPAAWIERAGEISLVLFVGADGVSGSSALAIEAAAGTG